MSAKPQFLIGADPEMFLIRGKEAVPAVGLVPGTKAVPYRIDDGAVQVDGLALEINVDPVSIDGSPRNFVERLNRVTETALTMAREKYGDPRLKISGAVTMDFSKDSLKALPPEALELGCDPDWNAYTLALNPAPDGTVDWRATGGHIHMGWMAPEKDFDPTHPDHLAICARFVKMMDLVVGTYMTVIDDDQRRRDMYGKAGAFRPKNYGCEYRTPSAAWLRSDNHKAAIFELSRAAVSFLRRGYTPTSMFGAGVAKRIGIHTEEDICRVINTGDWKTASEVQLFFADYMDIRRELSTLIRTAVKNRRLAEEKKALKFDPNVVERKKRGQPKPDINWMDEAAAIAAALDLDDVNPVAEQLLPPVHMDF